MFEHILARFGHVEADEDLGIRERNVDRATCETAYQHPPDIDAVESAALTAAAAQSSEWANARWPAAEPGRPTIPATPAWRTQTCQSNSDFREACRAASRACRPWSSPTGQQTLYFTGQIALDTHGSACRRHHRGRWCKRSATSMDHRIRSASLRRIAATGTMVLVLGLFASYGPELSTVAARTEL